MSADRPNRAAALAIISRTNTPVAMAKPATQDAHPQHAHAASIAGSILDTIKAAVPFAGGKGGFLEVDGEVAHRAADGSETAARLKVRFSRGEQ